jgi:hypothetical protein
MALAQQSGETDRATAQNSGVTLAQRGALISNIWNQV